MVSKRVFCKRQLQNEVIKESEKIAKFLENKGGTQLRFNFLEEVDIYDSESKELLYFDDGVGVNRQKEHRSTSENLGEKSTPKVQTDVIVLGNEEDGFHYTSSAESNFCGNDIETHINLILSKKYNRLPIVAIIDGAQSIRCRLWNLFGENVIMILDWYHLENKIWQYMSRLGLLKHLKEKHVQEMLNYLWVGQVEEALIYSDVMIETQRNKILEELQNYLLKHKNEIINYSKRQFIGKIIGSGRGEKANDQLVAIRQKKKVMSWSEKGSNALAVIKSLEVNKQWENYWSYNTSLKIAQ